AVTTAGALFLRRRSHPGAAAAP
ncbi:MAG: hypothetical protein K0S88_4192, partial [Actinomycetia bacterium]|nr:hypothetical protein [Actinomycetes bacterium]